MHTVLFNVPAWGHLNPMLSVAAELVQRGEHVTLFNTPRFREAIEATGATFQAYPSAIPDSYFGELDGSNPLDTAATLAATTFAVTQILLDAMPTADYIMFDSMCPWGALIGELHEGLAISSNPLLLLTPAMVAKSGQLPHLLKLGLTNLSHLRRFQQFRKQIKERYGVPVPDLADFLTQRGDLTISYTSDVLQPRAESFSDVVYVGPALSNRPTEESFTPKTGRPLIFASLGTVINKNLDFYKACIEAFADDTYEVVFALGGQIDPDSLGALPDHIHAYAFVPQLAILKQASLFITHSGMNSVQEALMFNVPVVLVPQQPEQRMVAYLLERLGVGPLLDHTPTPAVLRSTVDATLTQPTEGYDKVAKSLQNAGGAKRAADVILERLSRS